MSEVPMRLRVVTSDEHRRGPRVGVMDGAIGGPERFASLAALFPHVTFSSAGATWPDRVRPNYDILVVGVEGASAADVETAIRRLKAKGASTRAVIVLQNADVMTTRRLIREGAADVLPAPPGEPALAACIERLLAAADVETGGDGQSGQAVAFLKAGGGVGCTALAAQIATLLAQREAGLVCLADFDLQFGAAALYLDLPEAMTVDDVLAAGQDFEETDFPSTLAAHRTGARILAAPREIVPLETLSTTQADAFLAGLKRDFPLTLLDLPSDWTAWTSRLLQAADRVVIVTQLSVPHMHLVKRQLRLLQSQGLDPEPILLVCNAVSPEHSAQVSLKAAERALGRRFDVVVPEDRRTMSAAINEGLQLSAVRRGTKMEKAVLDLADRVASDALVRESIVR